LHGNVELNFESSKLLGKWESRKGNILRIIAIRMMKNYKMTYLSGVTLSKNI
jgi:hypothetical protein